MTNVFFFVFLFQEICNGSVLIVSPLYSRRSTSWFNLDIFFVGCASSVDNEQLDRNSN